MKHYKHKILGLMAVAIAVVAGLASVVSAQVIVAPSYNFTYDLTVGSRGDAVVALQTFLENRGFLVMPVGVAKGYFGPITRAAVARYQAANAIAPAVGYFGPITRTHVNAVLAAGTPTTPTNPGNNNNNNNNGLSGGEADLSDFELNREESSGAEGDNEVEAFTAEFDVEDGDVIVQRMDIMAAAQDDNLEMDPWKFFDRLIILSKDGDELADLDVGDRDEWDEQDDDEYQVTISNIDEIFDEGDRAELTVAFDIANGIDTADLAQEFRFWIEDDGIRTEDSEGIFHYIGDDNETVDFGFDEEESGDLDLQRNSDDPDVMTLISDEDNESDEYTVFVFDIENNDDADALITDLTVDVATSTGDDINDILDSVTLVADGDEFDGDINGDGTITFDDMDLEIGGDDTVTFELVVVLREDAPESTLEFSVDENNVEAEGVDSGDDSDVSGSVSSERHIVSATGISVDAGDTTERSNDNDTIGTFTIQFEVTALEDDVYIYNGADNGDNDATPFSDIASTTGIAYTIYQGGSATTSTTNDSAVIQSSADRVGSYFRVEEGETETFTLTVSLAPDVASAELFSVELDAIRFGTNTTSGTADDTVYIVPNDYDFETNPLSLE